MTHPVADEKTIIQAVAQLEQDPSLIPLIAHYGTPTFNPHREYYQELVESIISQQLSVKAAATILKRFIGLFDGDSFPTPREIIDKDVEVYRSVGLSRQKASYIIDLAYKVLDGTVHFTDLDAKSNDEIIAELTQIKGVGVWTVHMFLIFCMGRLDVLPTGDLGIKNGFRKTYHIDHAPTPDEMMTIAEKNNWHPYESVASWYLWRSLENMPAL